MAFSLRQKLLALGLGIGLYFAPINSDILGVNNAEASQKGKPAATSTKKPDFWRHGPEEKGLGKLVIDESKKVAHQELLSEKYNLKGLVESKKELGPGEFYADIVKLKSGQTVYGNITDNKVPYSIDSLFKDSDKAYRGVARARMDGDNLKIIQWVSSVKKTGYSKAALPGYKSGEKAAEKPKGTPKKEASEKKGEGKYAPRDSLKRALEDFEKSKKDANNLGLTYFREGVQTPSQTETAKVPETPSAYDPCNDITITINPAIGSTYTKKLPEVKEVTGLRKIKFDSKNPINLFYVGNDDKPYGEPLNFKKEIIGFGTPQMNASESQNSEYAKFRGVTYLSGDEAPTLGDDYVAAWRYDTNTGFPKVEERTNVSGIFFPVSDLYLPNGKIHGLDRATTKVGVVDANSKKLCSIIDAHRSTEERIMAGVIDATLLYLGGKVILVEEVVGPQLGTPYSGLPIVP